ncbi:MAG: RNA 2',3'-cyclic phosphodiesterase [Anaerolineae bacterium]|nr:RNA 2',3'-cyclic phosphodiesterase [Anaerolineae bacterium]MCA9907097.1 RNA 2',3'-cyclic phosphodiesterase [Anaerolineae bacterium]
MPRLFIAVDLPDSVKDLLTRVRTDIGDASWAKRNTYHVTLRFLGDDVPAARIASIIAALNTVQFEAFAIRVQGVGRFPPDRKRAARVLWAGIAAPRTMSDLYAQIEQALVTVDFAVEERPFHPHVTLARLRASRPDRAVDDFLEQYKTLASKPLNVARFVLYESRLSPQGAEYSSRAAFEALVK